MTFVVDSSVARSRCFEDERTLETEALLERIGEQGAHVPGLRRSEVMNGLMMAERRTRIDQAQRRRLADFPKDLPIAIDAETASQV